MQTEQQSSAIPANRWLILAAVLVVLIMTPLDASAVNIVIPVLRNEFGLALPQVAWVVLVYLVVLVSLILPMGRLGDVFGFRKLYLLGTLIFTVASALCGLSPNFLGLVGARVLQGIGACLLMATSTGIATALFPPTERGRALGFVGMTVALGQLSGPTIGGWLTSLGGWRLIFFINLPIGLLGGLACYRWLPALLPIRQEAIDWRGAQLAVLTLAAFALALTQGEHWGWTSPVVLGLLAGSIALGAIFLAVERRAAAPMLDLTLFRNPVFTGSTLAALVNFLGQSCAIFLTPNLLEDGWHLPVRAAGLLMIIIPGFALALAPVSGALSDRIGTRVLATLGECMLALGLVLLAITAPTRNLPLLAVSLACVGVGVGLFQAPNNSAVMGSVPRDRLGIGGGVLATVRNLGIMLGVITASVITLVVKQRYQLGHPGVPLDALMHGIRVAFIAGAAFALLGACTSAMRADHSVAGKP